MNKRLKNVRPYQSPDIPVPPLRYDIQMVPVDHNGNHYIVFHDPLHYAAPDLALTPETTQLFSLFDGRTTLTNLYKKFLRKSDFSLSDLTSFVSHLDQNRVLHSAFYRHYAEETETAFEKSNRRLPTCSGSCYPTDKEELKAYFDDAFSNASGSGSSFKALYAPHIDYRVGIETYVKGFSRVRNLSPDRIVVIGTSHYAGYYSTFYDNRPFIFSGKEFSTPFGNLQVPEKIIHQAASLQPDLFGLSMRDRAHRVEHSIELHAVITQYLWGNDIEFIPILVNSLEETLYLENGNQAQQLQNMAGFIRSLDTGNTLFLISGDQAHIGKKFGDNQPARAMLEETKTFDQLYLKAASDGDASEIHRLVKACSDKFRICGFPPLSLFLHAFPEAKGTLLDYEFWDESEQESGVTFASVGFNF
jgi:AmmeMemoRadiSam system protein B